jgi:endo-1,3(4)-beta-glucanase
MIPAITQAAMMDLKWRLPPNYLLGAGDTYFSGKLLSRLARVLIVADEMGLSTSNADFREALAHLRAGVTIWINGSAESMFLYDRSWGGLVMCGCDYQEQEGEAAGFGHCANKFPNCSALVDQGQNFGAGFYNDHHYHFGYHIYAAAVGKYCTVIIPLALPLTDFFSIDFNSESL